MSFSYNPNIPNAPNDPADDQPFMQTNFASIASLIGVNHVGFNTATGGQHTVVQFINQPGNPVVVPGTGQLYTKTAGGDQVLYYESGNGVVSQLTALSANSTNGLLILPGGLLMQWGQQNPATSGTPISFPTPFSSPPYSIQITVKDNNTLHRAYVSYNTASTTRFVPILLSTNGNPESDNIAWFAIGPA